MIPKIIHHIWPGTDPFREKFHAWRASWMLHNPMYTMMFWNLNNIPYDRLSSPVVEKLAKSNLCYVSKSDMLRYEILYLFGGIYVDTDMECRKNFDPLLQTSSFVGMGYPNDGIPNAIMACEKGSEIFECITQVVAESYVRQWDIVNDPKRLYKDADGSMHKISDRFLTKAETIHPVHYFYPFNCIDKQDKRCGNFEESYAIHHWNGMEQQGWARIDYSACKEMAL